MLGEDQRHAICDTGVFNATIRGYMIAGMQAAGFDRKQIRDAILGLGYVLDTMTAAEAEKAGFADGPTG